MNAQLKYFRAANFLTSASNLSQCPEDLGIEVACVGRSNAGKSSLINALCQQNRLAKTSKTPGRTQLINFYDLQEANRLVDLPGYGYAKVSEKTKNQIQEMLYSFLTKRQCLKGIILIMDIRHPLTPSDQEMIELITHENLLAHIVLTKCDKLKRGAANNATLAVKKQLAAYDNVSVQSFSASVGFGTEALQDKLCNWFEVTFSDEAPSKS